MAQNGQKEYYKSLMKDIQKKRMELNSISSKLEKQKAIKKLEEALKNLEDSITKPKSITEILQHQKEEIEILTETCEEELKETASKYEEVFNEYKGLLKEQKKELDKNLQSSEEIEEIQENYAKQKLEIKNKIKAQQQEVKRFNKKKNKIENNINTAEALGLSVDEYLTIESTLKNQEIMNRILEEKGLHSLVNKKKSELTKEEKEALKQAHNKIIEEISSFKANENDASIVDAIQSLYNIEDLYVDNGNRSIKMRKKDIGVIIKNTKGLPEKILTSKKKTPNNYVPNKAPIDMKNESQEESQVEPKQKEPKQYVINLVDTRRVEDVLEELFTGISVVTGCSYKDVKADDDFIKELHGEVTYNVVTSFNAKKNMPDELKRFLASSMKKESDNVKSLIRIYDKLDDMSDDDKYLFYREYNDKKLKSTIVGRAPILMEQVNNAILQSCHTYNSDNMNKLYSTLVSRDNKNIRTI